MKLRLIFFFTCFFSILSFAQTREDGFSSYESMVLERVIVFDAYSTYQSKGAYAYEKIDGKYKKVKDGTVYQRLDSTPLYVAQIMSVKNKKCLEVITNDGEAFCLLIDNKYDYLSNTSSISYWERKFGEISKECYYISSLSPLIDSSDNTEELFLGKYFRILWGAIQYPKHIQDAYRIKCEVNKKIYYWTLDELKDNLTSFPSKEELSAELALEKERKLNEKREKERLDSIADVSTLCEAKILHTIEAMAILEGKDIDSYDEKDTIYLSVFGCENKQVDAGKKKQNRIFYKGYALNKEFSFPASALEFTDEVAKAFIESRGVTGIERRMNIAKQNDFKRSQEYLDRVLTRTQWKFERLAAVVKFRQQKKILILSQDYSFSSYQFGLKFNFFNCYQKDIKYIDLVITAYNRVGDVQRDDVGRSSREVRCIGPLESGFDGEYDFNELFWDKNDIIDHLIVTSIKVTFMDNTVVSYIGKKNVELHTSDYFAKEQNKILHEGEDKIN